MAGIAEVKVTSEENVKIVREFYNSSVEVEWGRLVDKPEFILTCRMLDRYIMPGDRVLDIGGGPGRYSFYLAEKGCDVTLFDLSPENVNHVIKHSAESGLPVKTICGDAREADAVISALASGESGNTVQGGERQDGLMQGDTEQFDHVLLMGPLYHLLEEKDRVAALNAALNLLKPGGILFAAFISMSGGLVFGLREVPEAFADPDEERFLVPLVNGESYGGRAFTQAFFISQHEVIPFMSQFDLEKLHLFGQESILAPNLHKFMEQSPEVKEAMLYIAEKLCEREEYLSWSEHLMYAGRKSDGKG